VRAGPSANVPMFLWHDMRKGARLWANQQSAELFLNTWGDDGTSLLDVAKSDRGLAAALGFGRLAALQARMVSLRGR